jgi:single-strand DNA-binding protein
MSKSLNSVCISGYLGRAPKVFDNDDGSRSAILALAVNNPAKVDGEWTDEAMWTDVKVYGAIVDAIEKYLDSGSFVIVDGRMAKPRHWTTDEGEVRVTPIVVAKSVIFGPRTGEDAAPRQEAKPAAVSAKDFGDDDVPF